MNPIIWFEIYVDDMERARKFYELVFNTNLENMGGPDDSNIEMWSFPVDYENHGVSGALVKMDGTPAGKNSTRVYFLCEDCAIEESKIEKAGGEVQQSKTSIGEHGFYVLARDTEGNTIGLHSNQ